MKKIFLLIGLVFTGFLLVGCGGQKSVKENPIAVPEFNTEITGYYYTRPETIFEQKYDVAYFLVVFFGDEEAQKEIVAESGPYQFINGLYPFRLGCVKNGTIESHAVIDVNTQTSILNSTKENQVTVKLLGKNKGTDQPCDSFAKEIKLK